MEAVANAVGYRVLSLSNVTMLPAHLAIHHLNPAVPKPALVK